MFISLLIKMRYNYLFKSNTNITLQFIYTPIQAWSCSSSLSNDRNSSYQGLQKEWDQTEGGQEQKWSPRSPARNREGNSSPGGVESSYAQRQSKNIRNQRRPPYKTSSKGCREFAPFFETIIQELLLNLAYPFLHVLIFLWFHIFTKFASRCSWGMFPLL